MRVEDLRLVVLVCIFVCLLCTVWIFRGKIRWVVNEHYLPLLPIG